MAATARRERRQVVELEKRQQQKGQVTLYDFFSEPLDIMYVSVWSFLACFGLEDEGS